MTAKRVFLTLLTAIAVLVIGIDLFSSWNQPQFQSRLELYQTDLLLQAAQAQGDPSTDSARKALTDKNPQQTALESYQKTRTAVEKAIATAESQLDDPSITTPDPTLRPELIKQRSLRDELNVRIGLLQVEQGKTDEAIQTWSAVGQNNASKPGKLRSTATILTDLWRNTLPPNAEPVLKQSLSGWFRNRALEKLYTLEQRSGELKQLQTIEQESAQQALVKWVSANALPTIALILGLGLLLVLVGQRILKGKQSILAGTNLIRWMVPWDWETVWQVLVVGFFFVGQILIGQLLLPLGLSVAKSTVGIDPSGFTIRDRATLALITYLLLAFGSLGVLYWSIKSYLPLPEKWFGFSLRGKWFLWGLGGYLTAYPLVAGVSWINDQLWQGRGGSNPLLPIALESRDPVAIGLFLLTASIAAPLFEETFFRGFLLPSLTKYFTTWQAIILSGVLFAVVHLSLAEVIPLTTLGIILGFVYTRTQNLMASVLLHALWNSGTLLTLFLLGSAAT